MQNVIVYVDGFNLYFGLRSKGWKSYYWLNLVSLSRKFLKPQQNLVKTKYFTSFISVPPDKIKRQKTFIEALETLPEIQVFYGKYQSNDIKCTKCEHVMFKPSEKMTDVNIAVEMLADAFLNSFDVAILISADSDLIGPVLKIRKLFPDKKIIIAFPPDRFSYELQKYAHATLTIGRKRLADSLFPEEVIKPGGYTLKRPERWRHAED